MAPTTMPTLTQPIKLQTLPSGGVAAAAAGPVNRRESHARSPETASMYSRGMWRSCIINLILFKIFLRDISSSNQSIVCGFQILN